MVLDFTLLHETYRKQPFRGQRSLIASALAIIWSLPQASPLPSIGKPWESTEYLAERPAKEAKPSKNTASATQNLTSAEDIQFGKTQESLRAEMTHKTIDVDKIDTFSGALRLEHEDVRLRNGKLDLVVSRYYSPPMTYSGGSTDVSPNIPHPFVGAGLGYGWSFSVAPKVILDGMYHNNVPIPASNIYDKLCLGEDWWRHGISNWQAPYGAYLNNGPDEYGQVPTDRVTSWTLEHTNGQTEPLIPTALGEVRTASGWKLTCSAGSYTLRAPDGNKYDMNVKSGVRPDQSGDNWRKREMLQASKITDVNGNYVTLTYLDNYYIQRIASSDNQISLNFNYSDIGSFSWMNLSGTLRQLSSVVDHANRTWTYQFETSGLGAYQGVLPQNYWWYNHFSYDSVGFPLKKVIMPDATEWSYKYYQNPSASVYYCAGNPNTELANFNLGPVDNSSPACIDGARAALMKEVTYPTGGTITYDYLYSPARHVAAWPWDYFWDPVMHPQANFGSEPIFSRYQYSSRVKSRVASTGGQWSYSYQLGSNNGEYDITTVTTPDTTEIYKHIGFGYFSGNSSLKNNNASFDDNYNGVWRLGQLIEKKVGDYYQEVNEYTSIPLSTFWSDMASGPTLLLDAYETRHSVLSKRTITQDGANYVTTNSNWDAYGHPQTVAEVGQHGGIRTTTLTYLNDTSKWILGVPKDESSSGTSIVRTFDSNGQLLSSVKDGVTTSYTYYANGDVATKTLPRGLIHTYSNYKLGIPRTEIQPEGVQLTRTVDALGNISSEENGDGKTTSYTYDSMNRMTSVIRPVGNQTTITYTSNSKTVSRGSLVEATQYDGLGRPQTVTLGGIAINYSYDPFDRLAYKSHPDSTVGTSFTYDGLNRITRISNSDATYESRNYGPGYTEIIDENSKSNTSYYRAYGNPATQYLMSVNSAESAANITVARNTSDQVTSITQGGVSRTFDYNGNKYLTQVTNPESGTTIYGRDAAGNMTSRSVGASATTAFAYDNLNRLKTVTYPGLTPATSITYNKRNLMLTANSSGGNRTYTYDDNGNLKTEQLAITGAPSMIVNYDYTSNDQLDAITYPAVAGGGAATIVNYAPDVLGRPTKVGDYVTGISYWPSGQIKQLIYGNGTITDYGQNGRLWPSSFTTKMASTNYLNTNYGYDSKGNLATVSDSIDANFNRTLGYDGIDRVTSVAGPWGHGTITYDGSGNILSQDLGTYWNLLYSYSGNRVSTISGIRNSAFTYDTYGNIVSAYGISFNYDDAFNLRCANCGSITSKIDYSYDGNNQRSTVVKGGVKTFEMYSIKGNQLFEYTPSTNKLIQYYYLGDKRVAQKVSP